jgi:hypothetical protein
VLLEGGEEGGAVVGEGLLDVVEVGAEIVGVLGVLLIDFVEGL